MRIATAWRRSGFEVFDGVGCSKELGRFSVFRETPAPATRPSGPATRVLQRRQERE